MSNCVPSGMAARFLNRSARPVPISSVVIAWGTSPWPSVSQFVPVQSSFRFVSVALWSL